MLPDMRNITYQGVEDESRMGESRPVVVQIFPQVRFGSGLKLRSKMQTSRL